MFTVTLPAAFVGAGGGGGILFALRLTGTCKGCTPAGNPFSAKGTKAFIARMSAIKACHGEGRNERFHRVKIAKGPSNPSQGCDHTN
jgi:hypothetical protein